MGRGTLSTILLKNVETARKEACIVGEIANVNVRIRSNTSQFRNGPLSPCERSA